MAELSAVLNAKSDASARDALWRCCGSRRWVDGMLAARPFADAASVHATAERVWSALERADYLEAFSHHPKIAADPAELARKFQATADWSQAEQSGTRGADPQVLDALREGNLAYAARFGFTFIVCATGKSAAQMLALLQARIGNSPDVELAIAAAEQAAITRLRLEKLAPVSKITCHVLDTALGRPARDLRVVLEVQDVQDVPHQSAAFTTLGEATTDENGRAGDLLGGAPLEARTYRLTFQTGAYFQASAQPVFYPRVEVFFSVAAPDEPYHIPLLLSPFGYSTYRGR
jgi:2-oxo-4-hydroxy-4-carboxy-5-ureidoimidazoline decarboxylase